MNEILSDGYLRAVADAIDAECLACHQSENNEEGTSQRATIHAMLTIVGEQWNVQGFKGTEFTEKLKGACTFCLQSNRINLKLYSLTCAISNRVPERISSVRQG